MISAGQVTLFRFPQTDSGAGKLRPALILRKLPGLYDDWLICMITSNMRNSIAGFDEAIDIGAADFSQSGLKSPSVARISRLAVVSSSILLGAIGSISHERHSRIMRRLADWLVTGN